MSQEKPIIEAKEVNVRDLFRNRFFEIPLYQRPFSWNEENFQELVDDIRDAIDSEEENYFLGAILLRTKEDGITYEIVDGQQRLTSLIILLAVFRDCLNDQKIQKWLIDEGDEYAGIPTRERIRVWRDLQEIFSEYVYEGGGTKKFIDDFESGRIKYSDKDSPVYHLYEAMRCFRDFVEGLNDVQSFLKYLFTKIYFVRIITDDRSSAFRLFNVLNTRGLPLSAADVLKSMNLEFVPEDRREDYFRKWRELEEDIGRKRLESIISHVRTIFAEEKAKRELVDEFEMLFRNRDSGIQKGTNFFDVILEYGGIYKDKILDPQLSSLDPQERVRYQTLMDLMNRFLPFSDWVPPLMLFYKKFKDEHALYRFAFQLERKFLIEWCADFTATERLTSSINLIKLIKELKTPEDVLNKMFEHPEEIRRGRKRRKIDFADREAVRSILLSKLDDTQFYSLKGGKMARYMLLRLNMEMVEEHFPGYANIGTITVEHILPRSPQGEWLTIFSKEDVSRIVNKLGNLALLNKRRNSRASNYDFKKKKEKYFEVKHNPFAITAMLREYDTWDKNSFEKRHRELLNLAFRIYIPERLM